MRRGNRLVTLVIGPMVGGAYTASRGRFNAPTISRATTSGSIVFAARERRSPAASSVFTSAGST